MTIRMLTAASMLLIGCAYVSKSEYDELVDGDMDGWPAGQDCDDNNNRIYPYAPDVRGDGCDADCGMERDLDGDDWPDDTDCEPQDATSYPCASEDEGDGIDHDCDGDPATTRTSSCNTAEAGFLAEWGLDPDFLPAATAVSEEVQAHISLDQCGNLAEAFAGGGE
jgi:hypothetical protein